MCGIAGTLNFNSNVCTQDLLISMLESIKHRGPDSCGIAIGYDSPLDMDLIKIIVSNNTVEYVIQQINAVINDKSSLDVYSCDETESIIELRLEKTDKKKVVELIEKNEGIYLISHGESLEIFKEITFDSLKSNYLKHNFKSNICIGHVRLATESKVNRAFCHPFQSLYNDRLAIVHNGQITNYKKLKSKLEANGYRFFTDNDSEVVVNLLSYYLEESNDFLTSIKEVQSRLDGTFTVAAVFDNKLGVFKDNISAKPLWICEDSSSGSVYIASEIGAYSNVDTFKDKSLRFYELKSGGASVWE